MPDQSLDQPRLYVKHLEQCGKGKELTYELEWNVGQRSDGQTLGRKQLTKATGTGTVLGN